MDDPVVVTEGGAVRGTARDGALVFRGVPFAADTSGPGRFRPPAPVVPWEGVRDAHHSGPVAPQGTIPGRSRGHPGPRDNVKTFCTLGRIWLI